MCEIINTLLSQGLFIFTCYFRTCENVSFHFWRQKTTEKGWTKIAGYKL